MGKTILARKNISTVKNVNDVAQIYKIVSYKTIYLQSFITNSIIVLLSFVISDISYQRISFVYDEYFHFILEV